MSLLSGTRKWDDQVESGEVLAEIETDKATMEFESFQDGVLLHIGVDKGATAAVDSILAILGEAGEDVTELLRRQSAAAPAEAAPAPTPAPAPRTQHLLRQPRSSSSGPAAPVRHSWSHAFFQWKGEGLALGGPPGCRARHRLGPGAGSGEGGRIVKRDIEAYVTTPAAGLGAVESSTDSPVSKCARPLRAVLAESKFTAPHFYLKLSVDMERAVEARKAINAQEGVKVSFNDMVVKAVSLALKKHPAVNSAWMDTHIRTNDHVHIGVAVAVEDGLLVPVVRHADRKSLTEIGAEVKDYAGKARDKKLQPSDWEGNTFTISNLGMFGIEDLQPSSTRQTLASWPWEASVMYLWSAMAGGSRQSDEADLELRSPRVDGAMGAAFLQEVKSLLEHPVRMLA